MLWVWEFFGLLSGVFLGFLRLSSEASGSKNLQKLMVFKVFENATFWFFEVPDVSWVHPGLSLAFLVPNWALKWLPKVIQAVIKKLVKNDPKK